jgi:AcrR family transcriptional regulator
MAESPTRLPAGRHGLPREFVEQNQRERLLSALVDVVAERGYNATTVANITKAAGISRRTFYENFEDKESCFLAAYELVADHLVESMRAAAAGAEDWPKRVEAALATMLRLYATEPALARLCTTEPIAAGGEVAARHRETVRRFALILGEGRPGAGDKPPPPGVTEEALIGGIISLIVREISAERTEQLEQLLDQLTAVVAASYRDV